MRETRLRRLALVLLEASADPDPGADPDPDPGVRLQLQESLCALGRAEPHEILDCCAHFLQQHQQLPPPSRALILRSMCSVLGSEGLELGVASAAALVALAAQEMTKTKEPIPEWQEAASDVLVELGKRFLNKVMEEMLRKLQPGILPPPAVLRTFAHLATANVLGMVPFLGSILGTLVPMLGSARSDSVKCSLCYALQRFAESIQEFLAGRDRGPDPTIRGDAFAADLGNAFELLCPAWILHKDAKVREAALGALGPLSSLIPPETLEQQIPKILPGILGLYKKHPEPLPLSKSLWQVLEASVGLGGRSLEPHLEPLLVTLLAQICVPADPKNHRELLRCFSVLAGRFPERVVTFVLPRVESGAARGRVGALQLLRHLINCAPSQMETKKSLIISSLKLPLQDGNNEVKVAVVQLLGAMAPRGFLQHPGAEALLHFLLRQCALPSHQSSGIPEENSQNPTDDDVRSISVSTLLLLSSTVPSVAHVLWPLLLEFLFVPELSPALLPLCRSLTSLAGKIREEPPENSQNFGKVPSSQALITRLLAICSRPFWGRGRGVAALQLLQLLPPHPQLENIWNKEIPTLLEHLQDHTEDSLGQEEWEEKLLRFLRESLSSIPEKSWICLLVSETFRQLRDSDGCREEKVFLYKLLGTALGFCPRKDLVRKQLQEILENARYQEEDEREALASCFGICAQNHLEETLEKLEEFGNSDVFKKSSGIFSIFKERSEGQLEKLRGCLVLCLGRVAQTAPPELLRTRLETQIVQNLLRHRHSKASCVRLSAARCLALLCQSLSDAGNSGKDNGNSGNDAGNSPPNDAGNSGKDARNSGKDAGNSGKDAESFPESDAGIDAENSGNSPGKDAKNSGNFPGKDAKNSGNFPGNFIRDDTGNDNKNFGNFPENDTKNSGNFPGNDAENSRNDTRNFPGKDPENSGNFSGNFPGNSGEDFPWNSPGSGASITHKAQLVALMVDFLRADPAEPRLRAAALRACCHLLALEPPLADPERSELAAAALGSVLDLPPPESGKIPELEGCVLVSQVLRGLLRERLNPHGLQEIFQHLGPWVGSGRAERRERAVAVARNVLHFFLNNLRVTSVTPFYNLGSLLALLSPRCCDGIPGIRRDSLDCVTALLRIHLCYQGFSGCHRDEWLESLESLKEELENPDVSVLFRTCSALGAVMGKRIPPEQLPGLVLALLEFREDPAGNCSRAAAVVGNSLIRERGGILHHKVPELLACFHSRLESPSQDGLGGAFQRSVLLLGRQHPKTVTRCLLGSPLPLDSGSRALWRALGADPGVSAEILEQLLERLEREIPFQEIRPSLPGSATVRVATAPALAATCALDELMSVPEAAAAVLEKFPKLFRSLVLGLGCSLGLHVPKSLQGREKRSLQPCSCAVGALRTMLSRAGNDDVVRDVENSGGWELMVIPERHHDGIALLAGAVARLCGPRLPPLVRGLLPALGSALDAHRATAAAFLAELLSHSAVKELGLLEPVLEALAALEADPALRVRLLALRGLGNLASGAPEKLRRHGARLVAAMVGAMDDADDAADRLALEAMAGLSRLLPHLEEREARAALPHLPARIRPFFDSEHPDLRRSSILLLGNLSRFSSSGSEVFSEQILNGLVTLLLHLQDPDPGVVKACKSALRMCGPSLGCEELRGMFRNHLRDDRAIHYGEFSNHACKFLMRSHPELLARLVSTNLFYLKSPWPELRAAAAMAIGFLVLHVDEERGRQLDLDQLISTLQPLLRDPAAPVRVKVAETLGRLVRLL